MSKGRELVRACLGSDDFIDDIADDDNLRDAGLNSGEFVLIAMRIEEEVDRALTDKEIGSLDTIKDIDAVLAGSAHVAH